MKFTEGFPAEGLRRPRGNVSRASDNVRELFFRREKRGQVRLLLSKRSNRRVTRVQESEINYASVYASVRTASTICIWKSARDNGDRDDSNTTELCRRRGSGVSSRAEINSVSRYHRFLEK